METKKVYSAINAVQADLAKEGIGKNKKNAQQNYTFRGIDDMYNAIAPLLAKHHLVILPRLTSHRSEEREKSFRVVAEYEFDFVSSDDGSSHTVKMAGEAIDYSDKATNKTASAAYKYACMQVFCIPTDASEDADSETPEVQPQIKTPIQKLRIAEERIAINKSNLEWLTRNYDALVKAEAEFASCKVDYSIVKEKFEKAMRSINSAEVTR